MSFNSKYSGQQVENLLDQVANGNTGGGSSGGITVELDPIFSASPAAKITDENVSSWNNIEQQIAGKMDKVTLAAVATSGNYDDLSNKPTIPSAVTESTVSGWGFTKNTGTYSKPSTGIPKSDLASAVQTSLNKADTALQSEQYKGTVTSVKINGATKTPNANGMVDLGTIEGGGGSSSGGNYPKEIIEVVNGECYVNPNTYNIITIFEDTVIHFNLPTNENIYNEYFFEIFMQADFSVTFDTFNGIRWASGLEEPTFEMNDEIQISVDYYGFGLWAKF